MLSFELKFVKNSCGINSILHLEKVDRNASSIDRCKDAPLHQQHKCRQNPKRFLAPFPNWVDQQWADKEELEVDCKVPSDVDALRKKVSKISNLKNSEKAYREGWVGVDSHMQQSSPPIVLTIFSVGGEERPGSKKFRKRNMEQNDDRQRRCVAKVSMQVHSRDVGSFTEN